MEWGRIVADAGPAAIMAVGGLAFIVRFLIPLLVMRFHLDGSPDTLRNVAQPMSAQLANIARLLEEQGQFRTELDEHKRAIAEMRATMSAHSDAHEKLLRALKKLETATQVNVSEMRGSLQTLIRMANRRDDAAKEEDR